MGTHASPPQAAAAVKPNSGRMVDRDVRCGRPGPYTLAHVPEIDGIVDWSKVKEGDHYSIYHSRSYRHPERYAGKVRVPLNH